MKFFILYYQGLDFNDTGILAIYSNWHAVLEALEYANSLHKYFKVWFEADSAFDKFNKSDFG